MIQSLNTELDITAVDKMISELEERTEFSCTAVYCTHDSNCTMVNCTQYSGTCTGVACFGNFVSCDVNY